MGLLWRLFVPRKVKKVRRALSPTQLVADAIQPKALKRARRAAYRGLNPVQGIEGLVRDAVVRGRGGKKTRKRTASAAAPLAGNKTKKNRTAGAVAPQTAIREPVSDAWIRKNVPRLSSTQLDYLVRDLRNRGWSDADLKRRVYRYVKR